MKRVWVIGAGGHAKVVIDCLRQEGIFEPIGLFDDDPGLYDSRCLGLTVQGPATENSLLAHRATHAILAIGDNNSRKEIAVRLAGRVEFVTTAHPSAVVAQDVHLVAGTVVFAGVVVQPGTQVGAHAILNTACSVDHDCRVGEFCHVAPGAHLAGHVTLGEGALVGIGAVILPGCSLGAWSTLGAGAVLTNDCPPSSVLVGIPARRRP